MFIRGVFPGILLTVFIFLASKCCAQEDRLVYVPEDYFKYEPSLRCYDCNSQYDRMCADPFNPYSIGIVNCSDQKPPEHLIDHEKHPHERLKPIVCRKIVQKVEGRKWVVRGCGYIPDERDDKKCVRRSGTKNVEVFYCACTTTLCNPADGLRPTHFGLIVGVSVMALLGRAVVHF